MGVMTTIGLAEGREIMKHILEAAQRDGLQPAAICIVDARGNQLVTAQMDGSVATDPATARAKAVAAVTFREDIGDWTPADVRRILKIDPTLRGHSWNNGVPITSPHDGAILGAVGVHGRSDVESRNLASLRPSGWSA